MPEAVHNQKRWLRLGEYGLAFVLVALATGFRKLLEPYMGLTVPYVTYFLSNALLIRFTSLGPSILGIALSTFAAHYFFLEPRYSLWSTPAQTVTSLTFILANAVMLVLASSMRAAKEETERAAWRMNRSQEMAHLGNWELDLLTNKLSWSDEVYRIFGLQPREFPETYAAFLDAVHPEDREKVDAAYSGSVREGRNSYEIEHRVIRRHSGEVRFVHERCEHERNAAGRVVRSIGMVQDITDRKATERLVNLQASALNAAANAIAITDREGAIQWVNPAFEQLTGYSAAEALGRNHRVLKSSRHDAAFYKTMWDQIRSGRIWHSEIINRRKDGSLYTEEMTITPVKDARGEITNFIAIKQDITRRKDAEASLLQAKHDLQRLVENLEKTVEQRTAKLSEMVAELEHFSYTLTHDMRAPLRAMSGFAQVMWAEGCGTCAHCSNKEHLQRIINAAQRMDLMITEALNYNRALRAELPLVPVDPGAILREMLATYPNLQPIHADISLEGSFPRVLANEAALTQCFSNLLDNAVKFVPPGTKPRVRVWAEASAVERESVGGSERGTSEWADAPRSTLHAPTVRIWFEDNGIGIEEKYQTQIFGMFQRLTHDYEGTGIGLALVRKNIERMGGRVGVESQPGRGSRFWLELKLAPTPEK